MGIQTAVRARDLADLPRPDPFKGKHYELSEGRLIVVANAKPRQELVKSRFGALLSAFVYQNPIAWIFIESQFSLTEDTARVPDCAVVRNEKLANSQDPELFAFGPDIAIEILSPCETPCDPE